MLRKIALLLLSWTRLRIMNAAIAVVVVVVVIVFAAVGVVDEVELLAMVMEMMALDLVFNTIINSIFGLSLSKSDDLTLIYDLVLYGRSRRSRRRRRRRSRKGLRLTK